MDTVYTRYTASVELFQLLIVPFNVCEGINTARTQHIKCVTVGMSVVCTIHANNHIIYITNQKRQIKQQTRAQTDIVRTSYTYCELQTTADGNHQL